MYIFYMYKLCILTKEQWQLIMEITDLEHYSLSYAAANFLYPMSFAMLSE